MPKTFVIAEPVPDLSSVALRQVIGRRLRQLRRQKNLTQRELAKRARIAPNTVRGIETGEKRAHYKKLLALARALGTTVGVLMHAIDGEPDAWANPLLKDLLSEDLQVAQRYHHASTLVRTVVQRILANPESTQLVKASLAASYARYVKLPPALRSSIDQMLDHFEQFVATEGKQKSEQHSA